MSTIRDITGYHLSRDYERLIELAKTQSIVCIVDYVEDCRDVSQTIYTDGLRNDLPHVSSRGIGHVHASSRAEFVDQCKRINLEFLEPSKNLEARIEQLESYLDKTADGKILEECEHLYCPRCGHEVRTEFMVCYCDECVNEDSGEWPYQPPLPLSYGLCLASPPPSDKLAS